MQNTPEKISSKSWPLTLFYFLGAGILGGHRFYLGRKVSGTLQFLLFFSSLAYLPLAYLVDAISGDTFRFLLYLVVGSFGWYLLDLWCILTSTIGDERGVPVKAQKGELGWVSRSLLLCGLLILIQAFLVYLWQRSHPGQPGFFHKGMVLEYTLLMLWVASTWAFSYIALYTWSEWFVVKEAGVVFLIQPLFIAYWSLFFCAADNLVTFAYLSRSTSIDLMGDWLYRDFARVPYLFAMVLGFTTVSGLWILASMAASLVRKTDLYKQQGAIGWCALFIFSVCALLLGKLLSVFSIVLGLVLVTATIALFAPPFRQKMTKDEHVHGQVRPVITFSLLCICVAGLGLLLDYCIRLLGYLSRVQTLKSTQPWLSPSSEALRAPLIDWGFLWVGLGCMGVVLGRLVWVHRKQFRWALREARWTFLTFVIGTSSVAGLSGLYFGFVLHASPGHIRSEQGNLRRYYQRAKLSPFLQKKLGLFEHTHIASLLALPKHFFGKRQRAGRIWLAPRTAYALNQYGVRERAKSGREWSKENPSAVEKLLELYRDRNKKRHSYSKSKAWAELRVAVDPATSMYSVCQFLRAFSKHGHKIIWIQTPYFRAITIAGKLEPTIAYWHSHKLVWGRKRYQKSKEKALDVLYNDKLTKALKAGNKTLRLCHR